MKKFTKTYILGAILVVSILILLIPRFTNHTKIENNEPQKVFSFETKDVDKVELGYIDPINPESDNRKEVILQKIENKWVDSTSNNYKINEDDIKKLLEQVGQITQSELSSNNPKRQQELEIDDIKGVHVKIWNGTNLMSNFWLGKDGVDGNSTYFRLDGSDLVYSIKNSVRSYFVKPEWIDKTIWKVGQDQINKIVLNIDWQKIILEKKKIENKESSDDKANIKDKWEVVAPSAFEASEQVMTNLLNSLSNLTALEIIFDKKPEDVGLVNSKSKILVYLDNNDNPSELIVGKKIEKQNGDDVRMIPDSYYVKISNNDQIFTIHSYLVENLFKLKIEDLKVKSE